ncbi:alpha-endosulfine [Pieris brassicae]|nr:alpha-endosulfine [Pieris brassicae]
MSDTPDQYDPPKDPQELEKLEEAKLKAKFPNAMLGRGGSHSAFLQKRLAKGQKFFDSGDYQMAKQRPGNLAAPFKAPAAPAKLPTGDAIPTPETVPLRKTSIIQPKYQPSSQTS